MNVIGHDMPCDSNPESNLPVSDVALCSSESKFVNLTVSPLFIVIALGLNAKFLISTPTVLGAAVAVVVVVPAASGVVVSCCIAGCVGGVNCVVVVSRVVP